MPGRLCNVRVILRFCINFGPFAFRLICSRSLNSKVLFLIKLKAIHLFYLQRSTSTWNFQLFSHLLVCDRDTWTSLTYRRMTAHFCLKEIKIKRSFADQLRNLKIFHSKKKTILMRIFFSFSIFFFQGGGHCQFKRAKSPSL